MSAMTERLDWTLEINPSGTAWLDVTGAVRIASGIRYNRGMTGYGITERVAAAGGMEFALDNVGGGYAPGAIAGWDIGCPVRLSATSGTATYRLFYGRVASISPSFGAYGERLVSVACEDYIAQMARHKLRLLPVLTGKTEVETLQAVIANMPTAPLATDYSDASDTYTYSLSSERDERSTALNVAQKVAQSSFGWVYLAAGATGETLRYESRVARAGSPVVATLTADDIQAMSVVRDATKIINSLIGTAYPAKVVEDTTLATLQRVEQISAGGTLLLTLRYRDPTGAASRVSGLNMVEPVAGTHYKISSVASGSPDNDKHGAVTLSVTFGGNAAEVSIVNNDSAPVYVRLLELEGDAVLLYDPAEYHAESAESQELYGARALTYDAPYQDSVVTLRTLIDSELDFWRLPRAAIDRLEVEACKSAALLAQVLACDIGARIHVQDASSGVDDDFIIHGLEGTISAGGLLRMAFVLSPVAAPLPYLIWDVGTWDDTVWG